MMLIFLHVDTDRRPVICVHMLMATTVYSALGHLPNKQQWNTLRQFCRVLEILYNLAHVTTQVPELV